MFILGPRKVPQESASAPPPPPSHGRRLAEEMAKYEGVSVAKGSRDGEVRSFMDFVKKASYRQVDSGRVNEFKNPPPEFSQLKVPDWAPVHPISDLS